MLFDDEELIDEDDAPAAAGAGLLPPREAVECLGHEELEPAFLAMFESGRMPHAMIFAGPEGIGKATMAFRLARFLFKSGTGRDEASAPGLFGEALPVEKPESLYVAPDDPVFRQVASGGHADLLTIERPFDEKKGRRQNTVPVEEVRRVTPFLRMTAGQGGWRVVIVDDADTMNRSSQNAILKILEEPPANTLLILIVHRAGAMLPTIKSRCRTINFLPPAQDVFASLISRDHPGLDRRDLETLYAVAGGSIGRGLRILQEGGLEVVGRIITLLNDWPRWNWPDIHVLADTLARQGQDDSLRAFQEIFIWVVDTILRARATGETLPAVLNSDAVARLATAAPLNDWISISEKLKAHFDTINHASLDKKQAVLGAFMIFEAREAA